MTDRPTLGRDVEHGGGNDDDELSLRRVVNHPLELFTACTTSSGTGESLFVRLVGVATKYQVHVAPCCVLCHWLGIH